MSCYRLAVSKRWLLNTRRVSPFHVRVAQFSSINGDNNDVQTAGSIAPTDINHAAVKSRGNKAQKSVLMQRISDYAELSKFRLSALVVFTSGAGFVVAGAPYIDLVTMASCCVGTALCAAAAGTFNQLFEIDRDKNMKRTRLRPLPSGRITPLNATLFGLTTSVMGTSLLYFSCNPTVALLGAANIALYAGPYTLSKPHSESNTWVGAIVGAVPPVMGYAAATNGVVFAGEPMALAALLFLWQFPHFFALSWMHREDYARGNFQMVSVNDPYGSRTANIIYEYALYMSVLPIITSATGLTSYMFAVEGTMVNAYLIYLAKRFQQDQSNANARKVFLCSLWYLPLLLAAYILHSRVWQDVTIEEGIDEVTLAMVKAKVKLKKACFHEVLLTDTPQLCPKIVVEKTSEDIKDIKDNVEDKVASTVIISTDKSKDI